MNKGKKLYIDIGMLILLPTLMAYSLIGETFHEIIGIIMFALFMAHHYMNRGWLKGLFKGRHTTKRTFQTIINLLLLIFMIIQPVSGILMSKHVLTSIQIAGTTATVREIHLMLAYWGFVLLSVHAGMHLRVPLNSLTKNHEKTKYIIVICIISLYGCYAFIKRRFHEYMFLRTAFAFFDYSEPRIYFFLDYISIMLLFMFIGWMASKFLSRSRNVKNN